MCTVTYIPTRNGVLITSSRDERVSRPKALPPRTYVVNGYHLHYPMDGEAGGTWVAVKENNDAAVLLNGAFEKHAPNTTYRKSRGLVFVDIISTADPVDEFRSINLQGIQPFTMVIYVNRKLHQCVWDGIRRHHTILNSSLPHIWSSVTLYDVQARRQRADFFTGWLKANNNISGNTAVMLHRQEVMQCYTGGLKTISITALSITHKATMQYHDLQATALSGNRLYQDCRRLLTRLLHWEYWPFEILYAPLLPAWLWLSLKARSLLFFSAANPGIRYAGFIHEQKSDIYKLMPESFYPATILLRAGVKKQEMLSLMENRGLCFPVIAKPDIGERGVQVKLVENEQALFDYAKQSKVNFLVQEYIDYKLEAGIFYYRLPGEEQGHISGIVGKEFLNVTGDGCSTIKALLQKSGRHLLQLPALEKVYGAWLYTVLPKNKTAVLVPYGNHSRGAKFVDLQHRITPILEASIDNICKQVKGFYFGRLDIRFNSWEELEQGKHFSIIEVNGAGSEPTHIYDPAHSIWFAWKEIYRHWKLLQSISMQNVKLQQSSLMTFAQGIEMKAMHSLHTKLLQKNI